MSKIQQALTTWSKKADLQEYIKEKLGEIDETTGRKNIDCILNNAVLQAKIEEDPKWTKLLFDNIKREDKTLDANNQTNIFVNANELADETIKKLIDVTPAKTQKKIEDLI